MNIKKLVSLGNLFITIHIDVKNEFPRKICNYILQETHTKNTSHDLQNLKIFQICLLLICFEAYVMTFALGHMYSIKGW